MEWILKERIDNRFQDTSVYKFEKIIGNLFSKKGYHSFITSKTGDKGADIIADDGNESIAIQAKCYSFDNSVGVDSIKEVLWGMREYKCDRGIVVTSSSFTSSAIQSANKYDEIELWDYKKLRKELERYADKFKTNTVDNDYRNLFSPEFWDRIFVVIILFIFMRVII